ncbi:MAG: hypothetical protein ACSNEK_08455 [Parachlamydiaceae bacterium]
MLLLITALGCEAEPLIDHFGLQRKESMSRFSLFENETTMLAVCGVGKNKVATAIGYLYGLHPYRYHSWLNIGIAGHAEHEIGQGFCIQKLTDQSTKINYYPIFLDPPPAPTANLLTVDKPEKEFVHDSLCDMEGSSFFAAASHFSTVELIHSFKVISDNAKHSFEKLDKKMVSSLIGEQLGPISLLTTHLKTTASKLESIAQFQEQDLSLFFLHWHFTSTQKHLLKRILQKWQAIEPNKSIWDSTLDKLSKTASVLEYLEEKINSLPLVF